MARKFIINENRTAAVLTHHTATKNEIDCLTSMALVREFPQKVKQTIERLKQLMTREQSKLYPDFDRIRRCEEKIAAQQKSLDKYYKDRGIVR